MFVMPDNLRFRRFGWVIGLALLLSACVSGNPRAKPAPVIVPPAQTHPKPAPALPRPEPVRQEPVRGGTEIPAGLEAQIHDIWRTFPGKTGIAIYAVDDGWSVEKRGTEFFPQQSVSKLWVAMTVLDLVDSGTLSLNQTVRIGRDDLTLFHQPIRARVLANGSIEESILSLLEQSVTTSDCTANDSLLRVAGGPEAVRAFIAKKGLGRIRFGPGERLLQSGIAGLTWQQDYSLGNNFATARAALPAETRKNALDHYLADPVDGASPMAIARALARLSKVELLSPESTRLLLAMLERTSSGPNRLRAGVPSDWRFGHKTGTGQELPPVSTGYNDVGLMIAPDGKRYAVAVMIGDTTASVPARMQMMQSVSRAVAATHP
jgi:beta-lactamase class A